MTWIVIPERSSSQNMFVLLVSNSITAIVTWLLSRWYYKQAVVYTYLNPYMMAFITILALMITCCVLEAPSHDPWHDEDMISHVREVRTSIRERNLSSSSNASPPIAESRERKLIAVKKGRQIGVFQNWDIARPYVNRYRGAQFQGFATQEEAEAWLQNPE